MTDMGTVSRLSAPSQQFNRSSSLAEFAAVRLVHVKGFC